MNRDEGSYQLSHAYDCLLDATADRRIKTRKNWVPASSDEDLVMRSKRQNKVLKFVIYEFSTSYCYTNRMNLFVDKMHSFMTSSVHVAAVSDSVTVECWCTQQMVCTHGNVIKVTDVDTKGQGWECESTFLGKCLSWSRLSQAHTQGQARQSQGHEGWH